MPKPVHNYRLVSLKKTNPDELEYQSVTHPGAITFSDGLLLREFEFKKDKNLFAMAIIEFDETGKSLDCGWIFTRQGNMLEVKENIHEEIVKLRFSPTTTLTTIEKQNEENAALGEKFVSPTRLRR